MSLHADVAVPAHERRQLERLYRYVARPPLALDRLKATRDGRLAYRLKTPPRDGTTHVVRQRRELLERLAPLIPSLRAHQVRYHEILAPCASGRDRIVPGQRTPSPASRHSRERLRAASRPARAPSLKSPPAGAEYPRRSLFIRMPNVGGAENGASTNLSAPRSGSLPTPTRFVAGLLRALRSAIKQTLDCYESRSCTSPPPGLRCSQGPLNAPSTRSAVDETTLLGRVRLRRAG